MVCAGLVRGLIEIGLGLIDSPKFRALQFVAEKRRSRKAETEKQRSRKRSKRKGKSSRNSDDKQNTITN